MSQINADPGGYRAEDRGSRWLLPLIVGLLALAAIAWVLFARPFGDVYGTTATNTRPAVTAVAPGTGAGGTTDRTGATPAGTTGTGGYSTGGTGGYSKGGTTSRP